MNILSKTATLFCLSCATTFLIADASSAYTIGFSSVSTEVTLADQVGDFDIDISIGDDGTSGYSDTNTLGAHFTSYLDTNISNPASDTYNFTAGIYAGWGDDLPSSYGGTALPLITPADQPGDAGYLWTLNGEQVSFIVNNTSNVAGSITLSVDYLFDMFAFSSVQGDRARVTAALKVYSQSYPSFGQYSYTRNFSDFHNASSNTAIGSEVGTAGSFSDQVFVFDVVAQGRTEIYVQAGVQVIGGSATRTQQQQPPTAPLPESGVLLLGGFGLFAGLRKMRKSG